VSKSDEFSDLTHIVIEILRCEIFTFSIHTSINRSMSPMLARDVCRVPLVIVLLQKL
jgi:hypothetical protein